MTLDEQPCVNDVHMAADNKFGCARTIPVCLLRDHSNLAGYERPDDVVAFCRFVEFRCATECSNAIALDGMQLLDKALRVARPNDYAPAPVELMNAIIPAAISATVTSSSVPQASIRSRPRTLRCLNGHV